MKVLIWDPMYRSNLGGGQVVGSNLKIGLEEAGIECQIASMRKGNSFEEGMIDIPLDLRLRRILHSYHSFEIFAPFLARALLRIIREGGYDFVHIEHPVLLGTLLQAVRRVPESRRPMTIFDLGSMELDLSFFRGHMNIVEFALLNYLHERWYSLLSKVDFLNAFSSYNVGLLKARHIIPREGTVMINMNMVPDEWFDVPVRRERYFGARLQVYIPGRIERVKGHGLILEAAREVIQRHGRKDIQFRFTGRGRFRRSFLKRIREYQISASFADEGWVPYSSLKSIFHETAVGLIMYQHAGVFSQVLVESMSTGNCVVVSNLGAFREAVDDGRNGLLVPNDDPKVLANTLVSLADNREKVRQLGFSALVKARSAFRRSVIIKKLAQFYEKPIDYEISKG